LEDSDAEAGLCGNRKRVHGGCGEKLVRAFKNTKYEIPSKTKKQNKF
jgi:hypothetical protein